MGRIIYFSLCFQIIFSGKSELANTSIIGSANWLRHKATHPASQTRIPGPFQCTVLIRSLLIRMEALAKRSHTIDQIIYENSSATHIYYINVWTEKFSRYIQICFYKLIYCGFCSVRVCLRWLIVRSENALNFTPFSVLIYSDHAPFALTYCRRGNPATLNSYSFACHNDLKMRAHLHTTAKKSCIDDGPRTCVSLSCSLQCFHRNECSCTLSHIARSNILPRFGQYGPDVRHTYIYLSCFHMVLWLYLSIKREHWQTLEYYYFSSDLTHSLLVHCMCIGSVIVGVPAAFSAQGGLYVSCGWSVRAWVFVVYFRVCVKNLHNNRASIVIQLANSCFIVSVTS